jgi:hypothetical protein
MITCAVLVSVVVITGSIPSALHMSIISKGPQPLSKQAFQTWVCPNDLAPSSGSLAKRSIHQ